MNWSPYHYCKNNPISLIDNNGLLPGDPFNSEAQAAHDFGKNYNLISFAINGEISTTIYKYSDDEGNTKYTYAIPNSIAYDGANPGLSEIKTSGYEKTAEAHTHGRFSNDKVGTDATFPEGLDNKNKTLNQYLIGQSGLLLMFNPNTGETKTICKDLPKDNTKTTESEKTRQKVWWNQIKYLDKRPFPLKVRTDAGYQIFPDAKSFRNGYLKY